MSNDKPVALAVRRGAISTFSRFRVDEILYAFANGAPLTVACREQGIEHATFLGWARKDFDGLLAEFEEAQEANAIARIEECFEIADDSSQDWEDGRDGPRINREVVARSKLRVETRQWYVEQMLFKRGDKAAGNNTQVNIVLDAGDRAYL